MSEILNPIKATIRASGESLRAIGRGAGVSYASLSRLMSGDRDSLTIDTAEKLARYFGLTFEVKQQGRTRGRDGPGR